MGRKADWFRHLRNEAERLLKEYAFSAQLAGIAAIPLPVPLERIAFDLLKFDVIHTDQLEDHISGFVDFPSELIRINTRDRSPAHQFYSLGHEIGHVRLHRKDGLPQIYRCTRASIGAPAETPNLSVDWAAVAKLQREEAADWRARRREMEANVFAAALTMPAVHLVQLGLDAGADVAGQARRFGVSVAAMRWRLEDLAALRKPAAQGGLFDE
jgi:IrrE N-terminal-like domain